MEHQVKKLEMILTGGLNEGEEEKEVIQGGS